MANCIAHTHDYPPARRRWPPTWNHHPLAPSHSLPLHLLLILLHKIDSKQSRATAVTRNCAASRVCISALLHSIANHSLMMLARRKRTSLFLVHSLVSTLEQMSLLSPSSCPPINTRSSSIHLAQAGSTHTLAHRLAAYQTVAHHHPTPDRSVAFASPPPVAT